METSKNEKAKRIVGSRPKGTPLFFPHELGYACPICKKSDEVYLEWSEYNTFIWCKKCNLDIPSCLCVKYASPNLDYHLLTTKERIKKATDLFLESVDDSDAG